MGTDSVKLRETILNRLNACNGWDKDKFEYIQNLSNDELVTALSGDNAFNDNLFENLFTTKGNAIFDTGTMGKIFTELYQARKRQGLSTDGDISLLQKYADIPKDLSFDECEEICEKVTGGKWIATKKLFLDLIDGLNGNKLSPKQTEERENLTDIVYARTQNILHTKPIQRSLVDDGEIGQKYRSNYAQYTKAKAEKAQKAKVEYAKTMQEAYKKTFPLASQILPSGYNFAQYTKEITEKAQKDKEEYAKAMQEGYKKAFPYTSQILPSGYTYLAYKESSKKTNQNIYLSQNSTPQIVRNK